LHLLDWNPTSLAEKLQKSHLHKIPHTPHPEQRETDKKPNLSNAPKHRNFRNKRSHAPPRNRNLLPFALQSETLRKGKATNNYAEMAPSNGAANKINPIRRCDRGNGGCEKLRRGRANSRRGRLAGGRSLVWREKTDNATTEVFFSLLTEKEKGKGVSWL